MIKRTDITFVNIPVDIPKKLYDNAFSFSRTINFGLLAIAGYLWENNVKVSIFDLQLTHTKDPLDELISQIRQDNPKIIGLSCISGFGYEYFKKVASVLRKEFPNKLIIAGGQSHVGVLAEIVLEECPSIDVIVMGEGEKNTLELLHNYSNKLSFAQISNLVYRNSSGGYIRTNEDYSNVLINIPKANLSLYPSFQHYPPIIEVSRGCPFKCVFCTSGRTILRKKAISDIISEIESIVSLYKSNHISIYFQAPLLTLSNEELYELINFRKEHKLEFTWRAETRVEYLLPDRIELLAQAGMKVIDVGFESGSRYLLSKMNKTNNPSQYLSIMSSALHAAKINGLLIKLNIMFYAGENVDTFRQTLEFLDNNSHNIRSISAYPLFLYPGSNRQEIIDGIYQSGGSLITTQEWKNRHLFPVNPSSTFSYSELQDIGIVLAKSYQTIRDFYFNKSHGYFCPGTTYNDFKKYIQNHDIKKLPFSRNLKEAKQSRKELTKLLAQK